MTTIIAGEFETKVKAERALAQLRAAGIREDDLCEFRVNPPGEHDRLPIGGDRDESPGAKGADKGAMKGAAVGGAVGIAAGAAAAFVVGPLAVPVAAGVGAYAGSLVGGLSEMEAPNPGVLRAAGELVAVNAGVSGISEDEIARILSEAGADGVERAEGTWANGEWADFDPVRPPNRIVANSRALGQP